MKTKLAVLTFVAFLFTILSFGSERAIAGVWYVDNGASGKNNGTSWDHAWTGFKNIKWGSGGVEAGDLIYISGGPSAKTYNEQLSIGANGTSALPITIRPGAASPHPAGHEGTVIIHNAQDDGIFFQSKSHITIDGQHSNQSKIRITGSALSGIYIVGNSHHILLNHLELDHNGLPGPGREWQKNGVTTNFNEASGRLLEISNCNIHDNYQDGLHILGARGPNEFDRILIHHNRIHHFNDDGIEIGIRGLSLYDNVFHSLANNGGIGHPDGIQTCGGYMKVFKNTFYNIQHPSKPCNAYMLITTYYPIPIEESKIYVYNNLIYHTPEPKAEDYTRGIKFTRTPGGHATGVSDVYIVNNTIVGTPFYGLSIWVNGFTTVRNVNVLNNIIYNCYRIYNSYANAVSLDTGKHTIGSYGGQAQLIIDYNIIHAGPEGADRIFHGGNIYDYSSWTFTYGTQKHIKGNPDPKLSPTYKLTRGSPAIDTGVNLSDLFADDKDGNSRPKGTLWDIGAFEFRNENASAAPANPVISR